MKWVAITVLLSIRIAYAEDACSRTQAAIAAEQWSAAEVLLDQCAAHDAPPWLATARSQLADKLENFAPVTIVSVPPANVSVSTFPADLHFAPRTIHLPNGMHTISVTAPDHESRTVVVRVIDPMPQRVLVELKSLLPPPLPRPTPSRGPYVVIAAGVALMLVGATYHILELEPERQELAAATDPAHDPDLDRYAEHSAKFDERRQTTIAIYGAGVVTMFGGAVWRFFEYRRSLPEVKATPMRGGAVIGVQWRL